MFSFNSTKNKVKNLSLKKKCFILILGTSSITVFFFILLYPEPQEGNVCRTEACYTIGLSIKESLDLNVDPCNDFYSYCCNRWHHHEEIPPDLNRYGVMEMLNIYVLTKLNKLLSTMGASSSSVLAVQNVKCYYESCMNLSAIENQGMEPLIKFLSDIGGWPAIDKKWSSENYDLQSAMAIIQLKTSYGFIIPLIISADPINTTRNVIQLDQPTLSFSKSVLQNLTSEAAQKELSAFRIFFSEIVNLMGSDSSNIDKDLRDIVDLEARMFTMMSPEDKISDFNFWYNRMTIEKLQALAPEMEWLHYLQKVTNSTLSSEGDNFVLQNKDEIIVRDFTYIKEISKYLLRHQNNRQIANYLGWKAILSQMIHLPSNFTKIVQKYSANIGIFQNTPERWKTCTSRANVAFSYVTAYMFIKEHFPKDVKYEVQKLALDLKLQFKNILLRNSWMDNTTRYAALKKLSMMKINVGYPEWIEDEKALGEFYNKTNMPHMTDNAFENEIAISQHKTMTVIANIRKENIKQEWPMTPLTINAGYNRNLNSITFPAAFLQLPLYDKSLPSYYNYAAIGSVIGHEITHGFDNEGSQRNENGEFQNWWSEESKKIFEEKANCFIEQYNKYELNGKRTLAENIADNGGLSQAYQAFVFGRKRNEKELLLPGLENYNIEQSFFLSYGFIWCTKYRTGALNYMRLNADHSPAPYRLNLTTVNLEYFSKAFNCKLNSPQKPNKTCSIWGEDISF